MQKRSRWQDWMTLVLGIWLFCSPFLVEAYFPYTSLDDWNSYMAGVALIIVSMVALRNPERWEEWFNILIGVWLIISPFLLGFASTQRIPTLNHIVIGIIVTLDAAWVLARAFMRRRRRHMPLASH